MAATASIKAVVTAEDKASPTLNKVSEATSRLGGAIKAMGDQASSSSGSFGKLAASFAVGSIAANALVNAFSKVGSTISNAFKSTADFEQYRVAFETMLGSADAARSMLSNLSDFAQRTPFQLPEVVEGAKQLLAYGIAAQDILPDFNALGNVAAGVGKDKLPQLTLAFGQVATKGRLMGQEIRQFTEAGVPLVQQLAKTFNTTTQNITAMSEKGQISFGAVREALYGMSAEGGRFFDLMEKQAHTFGGIMSNIGDDIGHVARQIVGLSDTGDITSGGPFDRLKKGAENLHNYLNANAGKIAASFQAVGQMIMPVFEAIGVVFRVINPGFALAAIGTFLLARAIVGSLIPAVFAAIAGLTVMNAVLIGISILIAVVLGKAFSNLTENISNQTKSLGDNTSAGKQAAAQAGQIATAQDDLGKKIQKVNDDMDKENRNFAESMAQMVKDAKDKVKSIQGSLDQENQDFKDSQESAIGDHNDRVQKIQQQIQQELNLGILADQRKLASYQAELAKENAEYDKQQAKDQADHDKKVATQQAQLDTETALLQKHAADVDAVRNVQLLDEFDALKRSHVEQMEQYRKQKNDIITNAGETIGGITGAFTNASAPGGSIEQVGKQMGDALGKGLKDALGKALKDTAEGLVSFFGRVGNFITRLPRTTKGDKDHDKSIRELWNATATNDSFFGDAVGKQIGNANGTDYWRGGRTMIGEQGPELLDLPQGSKITPNNKLSGTGNNAPINITINAQAFAGSQMEARKFATMLMDAFADAQSAKGLMT